MYVYLYTFRYEARWMSEAEVKKQWETLLWKAGLLLSFFLIFFSLYLRLIRKPFQRFTPYFLNKIEINNF